MSLELVISMVVSLIIICLICCKLSIDDEKFDKQFREEEED